MSWFPMLTAHYSDGRTYGMSDSRGRNTKAKQFGANLTRDFGSWTGRYSFDRSHSTNRATLLESTSYRHAARLDWSRALNKKRTATISGEYDFGYNTRTDQLPTQAALLHVITPADGLYSLLEDAGFGQLNQMRTLTDQDDSTRTDPEINIGTGTTNQQVGVDLSISREVGGFYIYTDRISDEGMTWSVYISDDGMNWAAHDMSPDAYFDAGVNRYELVFATTKTRYIKAVSGGLNRVENVFVTEIEPVARVQADNELTQSSQTHAVSAGATVRLNERWTAITNASYQRIPSVGLSAKRENFGQSVNLNFEATPDLGHSFRWQFGTSTGSGDAQSATSYLLSYGIRYTPLPTLRMSAGVNGSRSVNDGSRDVDNLGFSGNMAGEPLPDLRIELSAGYGYNKRYLTVLTSSSWRNRFVLNARVLPSLTIDFDYSHQTSTIREMSRESDRDSYRVGLRFRPLKKIYARGTANWSRGLHRYDARQLSIGWNLSKAISLSGSYRTTENSSGYRSERLSANLSWRMRSGNSIYIGYNESDLSRAGGFKTESISAGLRMRL